MSENTNIETSAFASVMEEMATTDNDGAQAPSINGLSFRELQKAYVDAARKEAERMLVDGEIDFDEADIRYSTAINLEKLRASSFCIVGAGGLGNRQWKTLESIGARRIAIYDDDNVGIENIGSQCHGMFDIGRPKVEAVADAALLYKGVSIVPINKRIPCNASDPHPFVTIKEDLGFMPDIIIGATDNTEFRNKIIDGLYRLIMNTPFEQLPKLWIDYRMSYGDWTGYVIPVRRIAYALKAAREPVMVGTAEQFIGLYKTDAVFSRDEAVQEACTSRAISYTPENVSSFTGAIMNWWFDGGEEWLNDDDNLKDYLKFKCYDLFKWKTSFSAREFRFLTETRADVENAKRIREQRKKIAELNTLLVSALGYDRDNVELEKVLYDRDDGTQNYFKELEAGRFLYCPEGAPQFHILSLGNGKYVRLDKTGGNKVVTTASELSWGVLSGTMDHTVFVLDVTHDSHKAFFSGKPVLSITTGRFYRLHLYNDALWLESVADCDPQDDKADLKYEADNITASSTSLNRIIEQYRLSMITSDKRMERAIELFKKKENVLSANRAEAVEEAKADEGLRILTISRGDVRVGDIINFETISCQLPYQPAVVMSTDNSVIRIRSMVTNDMFNIGIRFESFELIAAYVQVKDNDETAVKNVKFIGEMLRGTPYELRMFTGPDSEWNTNINTINNRDGLEVVIPVEARTSSEAINLSAHFANYDEVRDGRHDDEDEEEVEDDDEEEAENDRVTFDDASMFDLLYDGDENRYGVMLFEVDDDGDERVFIEFVDQSTGNTVRHYENDCVGLSFQHLCNLTTFEATKVDNFINFATSVSLPAEETFERIFSEFKFVIYHTVFKMVTENRNGQDSVYMDSLNRATECLRTFGRCGSSGFARFDGFCVDANEVAVLDEYGDIVLTKSVSAENEDQMDVQYVSLIDGRTGVITIDNDSPYTTLGLSMVYENVFRSNNNAPYEAFKRICAMAYAMRRLSGHNSDIDLFVDTIILPSVRSVFLHGLSGESVVNVIDAARAGITEYAIEH